MNYEEIVSEFLIKDISNIISEYINIPTIDDLHEKELIEWNSYDDLNLKIGDIIIQNYKPYKISKITKKLFMYGTELDFLIEQNDNYSYTKIYNTKYISNKEKVKFNKNITLYGYPCFHKLLYEGLFKEEYKY